MLKSQAIPMIGALRRLEPILVGDHVDFNQSQIMGTQSPPAFCRLVTCICMCSRENYFHFRGSGEVWGGP